MQLPMADPNSMNRSNFGQSNNLVHGYAKPTTSQLAMTPFQVLNNILVG